MRRFLLSALVAGLLLSLSACFLEPAENLYAIPRQSDDYYDLQTAIESAMSQGASYAPPVAGDNQQAVQMVDLDGDSADEAVVYLKTGAERPLSVCVFDKRDEKYDLIARVDVEGSSFDHVQYVQIDGAPGYEIVLGSQISEQVAQKLSVFTLHGETLVELLTANYEEFITTDLDADGNREIFLLHAEGEQGGVAELYRWDETQLQREREARLTTTVKAVKRIITGKMCREVPAVFVASEYGEGKIVTDIFGFRNGVFSNFALSEDSNAVATVRDYYVYSCDIDADGLIEIPRLIALPSLPGDGTSRNRSIINWYNLLPDGSEEDKGLTFHNYSGGWYLNLPAGWKNRLAVTRVAAFGTTLGHRFLLTGNSGTQELFSIVSLSGEKAKETLQQSGWLLLAEKGETVYGCSMGDSAERCGVSYELLRQMFCFIHVDWKTGETE